MPEQEVTSATIERAAASTREAPNCRRFTMDSQHLETQNEKLRCDDCPRNGHLCGSPVNPPHFKWGRIPFEA